MVDFNKKMLDEINNKLDIMTLNNKFYMQTIIEIMGYLLEERFLTTETLVKENKEYISYNKKMKQNYLEKCFAYDFAEYIEQEEEYELILKTIFSNKVTFLKAEDFKNNPYIRDIKINEIIELGNITVDTSKILENQLLLLGEPTKNKDFTENIFFVTYDNTIEYPVLRENGEDFIYITKSEMSTQDPHIKNLKGNVLIFGLGLGYSTYMTLLKDNVKSVTVVEKNPIIIEIFNKYILPQFKTDKKLTIIEDDALEYFLDKEKMNKFDSCFIDIWYDYFEGLNSYCFFKENEKGINCKLEYHLDYTFKSYMKQAILNGFNLIVTNDMLIDKINKYFTQKNIKIQSPNDIFNKCMNSDIVDKIFKIKV